jgi:hypothetical protein
MGNMIGKKFAGNVLADHAAPGKPKAALPSQTK